MYQFASALVAAVSWFSNYNFYSCALFNINYFLIFSLLSLWSLYKASNDNGNKTTTDTAIKAIMPLLSVSLTAANEVVDRASPTLRLSKSNIE